VTKDSEIPPPPPTLMYIGPDFNWVALSSHRSLIKRVIGTAASHVSLLQPHFISAPPSCILCSPAPSDPARRSLMASVVPRHFVTLSVPAAVPEPIICLVQPPPPTTLNPNFGCRCLPHRHHPNPSPRHP
jgi:hypothetical protein